MSQLGMRPRVTPECGPTGSRIPLSPLPVEVGRCGRRREFATQSVRSESATQGIPASRRDGDVHAYRGSRFRVTVSRGPRRLARSSLEREEFHLAWRDQRLGARLPNRFAGRVAAGPVSHPGPRRRRPIRPRVPRIRPHPGSVRGTQGTSPWQPLPGQGERAIPGRSGRWPDCGTRGSPRFTSSAGTVANASSPWH